MAKSNRKKAILSGAAAISLSLLQAIVTPSAFSDSRALENLNVTWIERFGFIIHDSICTNFNSGSIEKLECRLAAKEIFEKECEIRKLKDKSDEKRVMYCRAAAFYEP